MWFLVTGKVRQLRNGVSFLGPDFRKMVNESVIFKQEIGHFPFLTHAADLLGILQRASLMI